jgi:predicted phage baseplate assembly protein
MPLPLPALDRLTYDELVSEARRSLPALAPGWTDYNAHDPGITLIELLAWLTESESYRLDNISDESYRAFLRLAGVVLRPAQVAGTLLVFQSTATAQSMSSGVLVQSQDGNVAFQSVSPLFVASGQLQMVVSGVGSTFEDVTLRNVPTGGMFLPFGLKPQSGDALYLGFTQSLATTDSFLSLGLWTGNTHKDEITRTALAAEQAAVDDEATRVCPEGFSPHQPDWRQHYGARTVWEYYTGNGRWLQLKDVVDETRALTLTGTVQFKVPALDPHVTGGVLLPDASGNYFIRCRLERGGYDCPPRVAYTAINTAKARHAVDVSPHTFRSTGRACQRFDLKPKPVVPDSLTLTVTLKNGKADGAWQVALLWDGVGPHARTCVLDAEAGTLVFGDGRIGRVPPAEAEISVTYQTGGGASGNVPAGTLVRLAPNQPTVQVEQPFAACGGAETETLNEAKARAVRELATSTRAVTVEDFESLALQTPGVPLARAHAISDYHPAMHCIPVSGSTTVVVVPPCPEDRPEPTAVLLMTVQRYLERRRVLTSEIHVVGPQYTTVAVSARLHARLDVDRLVLIREAQCALDRWFHPLKGGPDGQGWPIGRAVYRAELLALLNDLQGVLYVEDMSWQVDGQPASRCGNITICPHGLVASGIHEIAVNEGSSCHE